jgi:hypothetical protein
MCSSGVGDTCAQVTLGSEAVQLASFSTEGAVGEDDKFYVGLRCDDVTSSETIAIGTCSPGEFAVGLEADGSLVCRGLSETAMTVFRNHCSLFYGWRDGCDACTDAPSKWGKVKDGNCALGGGQDDTCTTMEIAGQQVDLFGLNTDGNVDGNDKFYFAFECK